MFTLREFCSGYNEGSCVVLICFIPFVGQIYVQIIRDSNDDPDVHEEAKKLFNRMERGKI